MKILIAGAGIAGLATALALRNHGISSEIIERNASDTGQGAGMYLPGNAVRALSQLGVVHEVRKIGSAIDVQQIFNSRGQLLNEVDLASFWRGCGGCLSLSRTALQRVLKGALDQMPIRYGLSIIDIRQDSGGLHVTFSDGSQRVYDLVIGADGIQSTVRNAVLGQQQPTDLGIASWRTIIDNQFGITGWTAMLGPKRTLLAIPVEESKLYVYADIADPSGAYAGEVPTHLLRELFYSFAPPLRSIVESLGGTSTIYAGRLREISASTPPEAGVVLVGDAAHAMSPSMAQGAGMAIEDALVLAEILSCATSIPVALETFSARRLERIQWTQKQSRKRDAVRSLPSTVRDFVLKRFGTGLYAKSFEPLLEEI